MPDEVWNEAAKHFKEDELSKLLLAMISAINVLNRLNVAVRAPVVMWKL